jgi:hypothetical protein
MLGQYISISGSVVTEFTVTDYYGTRVLKVIQYSEIKVFELVETVNGDFISRQSFLDFQSALASAISSIKDYDLNV